MNESLHALSGAYVVDGLDDAERSMFERHLPLCLDCQAEVMSLREAVTTMSHISALTPPPSLRASVLGGVSTIRPLPPQVGVRTPINTSAALGRHLAEQSESGLAPVVPMRRRRFRLATMVASAAAVAAVATGAVAWQPWADNTTSTLSAADRVLAASDAKHVTVKFTDGSTATVVRLVNQGRAVLVTQGMVAPPAGKAFELWLRNAQGTMVPAGLVTTAGDHKVVLKGDAAAASAVGITVEPKAGSPAPTSAPIAMFELDQAEA